MIDLFLTSLKNKTYKIPTRMKRCFKLVLQLFDFEISTKIEVFILKNIVLVTIIDFIEVFFITFIHSRTH